MALRIDAYTDLACPWCLVVMHRLDRVLANYAAGEIDVAHHAVLLNADLPTEGVTFDRLLLEKFGLKDPSVAWARSEQEAQAAGLAFDHRKQPMAYPTERGHTVIRNARRFGSQHRLAVALGKAYLIEGRNIADPDILAQIGEGFALPSTDVRAWALDPTEQTKTVQEAKAATAAGVSTIPHLRIGDVSLVGNKSEEEIAAAISRAIG